MKKGLVFLLLLVISTSLQANELSWLNNYGDALKSARTTARPLLLVISRHGLPLTSSDRSSADSAPQLSRDLTNAYVLCKIDANSGYGKSVAEAFRVREFPHSLIIDKTTTKILYSKAGHATAQVLKATLTNYQGEATHHVLRVAETRPQATVQTPPRVFDRPYFFRQPAFCNT